jgi:hypothetical protein
MYAESELLNDAVQNNIRMIIMYSEVEWNLSEWTEENHQKHGKDSQSVLQLKLESCTSRIKVRHYN